VEPTFYPSPEPTTSPTSIPTNIPTEIPTAVPTYVPTGIPSGAPSPKPTFTPTVYPSGIPTEIPTESPTVLPTEFPTTGPTKAPTPKFYYSAYGCPVELYILDRWGDGWGGAILTATNAQYFSLPEEDIKGFFPAYGHYGKNSLIVINPLATSTLSVIDVVSGPPEEYWEVYWSVMIEGTVYAGSYDSSLTLNCLWRSYLDFEVEVIRTSSLLSDKW